MRVAPYNCMWVLNLFNEESTVYEQVCYMYTCIWFLCLVSKSIMHPWKGLILEIIVWKT